jgi:large subunit ribosomal protein L9
MIMPRVFLLKDVEKVGMAGEIIKVTEGYAKNFLMPRKLGVIITPENESHYQHRTKHIEHRKEVIASNTSMLAEKITSTTVTLKKKMHDDDRLYGSISPAEIVDGLAQKGISISKSQVEFDKSIKTKGTYAVTIKLSSRLKPAVTVRVVSE